MRPKSSAKPLELVVSAIHCLREKKGSSPQNILRYLVGKYNVDTEILKPHIQTGLRRGLNFGMITQQSGLYRLNDILSPPLNIRVKNAETTNTETNSEKTNPERTAERTNSQRTTPNKGNKPIKKRALGRQRKRQGCIQTNKKKARKFQEKKKRTVRSTRRYQNELIRRKKQRRQKNGKGKTQRPKIDKGKKIKRTEPQPIPGAGDQKNNAKESKEETKANTKT